jgi:hypothetical protein
MTMEKVLVNVADITGVGFMVLMISLQAYKQSHFNVN